MSTKSIRLLAGATLLACILACLATGSDFLALHDIRNDYVSREVLRDFGVGPIAALPAWSETPIEWRAVEVSFLFRLGFLILIRSL